MIAEKFIHVCRANGPDVFEHLQALIDYLGNGDAGSALINYRNRQGKAALHWACCYGDIALVKKLVIAGASVSLQDNNGNSALRIAMMNRYQDIVDYLIANGAKMPSEASSSNVTQLKRVIASGDVDKVETFLSENNIQLYTNNLDENLVLWILNLLANQRLRGDTVFQIIELLLLYGANPNINLSVEGSLIRMLYHNTTFLRIIELLVIQGMRIDYCAVICQLICDKAFLNSTNFALQKLFINNSEGYIARFRFSHRIQGGFFRDLISEGNAVHVIDDMSLLHLAASRGDVDLVKLLLDAGADVSAQTINGLNALHFACAGSKIKFISNDRPTSVANYPAVIKTLLVWDLENNSNNCRPNLVNNNGALNYAIASGDPLILDALLEPTAYEARADTTRVQLMLQGVQIPSFEAIKNFLNLDPSDTSDTVVIRILQAYYPMVAKRVQN